MREARGVARLGMKNTTMAALTTFSAVERQRYTHMGAGEAVSPGFTTPMMGGGPATAAERCVTAFWGAGRRPSSSRVRIRGTLKNPDDTLPARHVAQPSVRKRSK